MRKKFAILTLGVLVIACSEQTTSTQPGTSATTPTFDISNAPAQSGIVVRTGFADILIWGVPSSGLEVIMGADAAAFCTLWNGGAGDPSPSFVSVMTYADKALFDRVLTVGQDREAATQVWPLAGGGLEGFCGMVLGGAAPLATGVTRGVQFFSDLGGSGSGADINLWNYHGLLMRPDGSQAAFSFQMHWRQGVPTKVTASLR